MFFFESRIQMKKLFWCSEVKFNFQGHLRLFKGNFLYVSGSAYVFGILKNG